MKNLKIIIMNLSYCNVYSKIIAKKNSNTTIKAYITDN